MKNLVIFSYCHCKTFEQLSMSSLRALDAYTASSRLISLADMYLMVLVIIVSRTTGADWRRSPWKIPIYLMTVKALLRADTYSDVSNTLHAAYRSLGGSLHASNSTLKGILSSLDKSFIMISSSSVISNLIFHVHGYSSSSTGFSNSIGIIVKPFSWTSLSLALSNSNSYLSIVSILK